MSSVHYKFKATLEYKTLTFDGLHIGVDELKKAICDKENIRTESFDLLLTNAHTKREYTVGELVPRNSSVVVQRVPRENAQKLPKVQDTSTSGIVQRGFMQHAQSSYVNPDDFARMSEEQRLAHIKQVSTEKYSAANYQRRPSRIMDGPPPPTYVCNRCNQSGHWYKSCPLVNTRKTTGIPMEELMETTQDDPNAMLHPSGRFVKPIMHHQARLQRKHEAFPGQPDNGGGSPYTGDDQIPVPEVYKCALCKGLQRDAVLAACCGNSFCAECYQQQLLTHPNEPCPGSDCTQQISADSLVPNKGLRAAIQKYLNEVGTGAELSMDRSGVNKPNVLTDTQSLLHKLMPDLANAQAKRELATAGRSPLLLDSSGTEGTSTPPLRVVLSIPPPTSKPSPLFGNLQQQQPQAVQQQAGPTPPAQNLPTSQMVPPIPGLPMFDPKKPPPPIIPATQNGAAGSVPGGVPVTAISPAPSMNHTPPITAGVQVVAAPSPLPAEALTQVWESFLKRKDEESAARNAGNGHGGGLFGKTTPIVNLQIGSSTMTTTTEQQQSKAVTPISVGPTAAGDGGIELLRPSSRDAQQLQVTTGLEPPGIGADSSLVRIPPQLAADSLSNNLMLSAAHQTAIRALGPNASACEITDVWKTFLRMKDSQQQKRHHSSHYADFPERRRFLRVKDSQPHKRHHSSSHYAVSPERRRHSWDDEKRAEEKDRNKKPYKKDKDEPEERKKKRAKPDEEEQHDEEDHERKKEKRAKEEPDGKKEKQHKKDEDRHEEKKKRLSMDEDEHHDGKKGKQAKPDEEEHDGKKEKRDKKDKEEHKRKEKRTKPDGDDKNKEENEEKPIKADEEMEEKRVKPDDQKHEEKEKQSKPDEEEEKINEDEQEEDKMWKQTMVEVEPAKKNLMQEELANKREENALEKREEANEEKRLKNDGEEEKHPKKKRSKKDKGKKDEKKSRKKHSDGKDRKKKRHKKDKEELRKRKRTRTDEEEQDEAERDRKKEKRDKRTKKHKKEKKSSRKHREKDDHDDK